MFSNPNEIDYNFDEGIVTEVDIVRKLCRVKTIKGQNLNAVQWGVAYGGSSRGGDRGSPTLGDKVIIHNGLGFPVIIAKLPRLQGGDNIFPIPIDTGEQVDTGNFGPANSNVFADQNFSTDMVAGDRTISSEGGGIFGVLRGGSILLRSSRLAQILISKLDDVIKIMARNWELYTDVFSDVAFNVQSRIFRYVGYANNFSDSRVEAYSFHQYAGDVAMAQATKTDYANAPTGAPATDDRIYKEQVTTGSGGGTTELMRREVHLDGKNDLVVQVSPTGAFTRTRNTNAQVDISFSDTNVIKINASQINLSFGGNPTIEMDANGIVLTFGGGTIVMNSSSIVTTFDNSVITSNDSGISCTYSGHFVNITGSGVQMG